MSIENITKKILSEAENYAESSIKNAENQSVDIINEAKKQAESIITETSSRFSTEADTIKNRKVAAAELSSRKMLLMAKQEAVKRSFDKALIKLREMPEEEYISFLEGEIIKIPNCRGALILNEQDRERIGDKLIKLINDKLGENKIELSTETIQASGGFVLKRGNVEINSTFETMLSSVKDSLTIEIADILFK